MRDQGSGVVIDPPEHGVHLASQEREVLNGKDASAILQVIYFYNEVPIEGILPRWDGGLG